MTPLAGARVVIRAIGPSLTAAHVAGALEDPTLELHDGNGALLQSNDDWVLSPDRQAIIDAALAPTNVYESVILATLAPGNYTAIARGKGNTIGVGLVEVYYIGGDN